MRALVAYRVRKTLHIICAVILLQVLFPSQNAKAFVYWSNPSGSTALFSWQNGGSDNGLFGDPELDENNTFIFEPTNFVAMSLDGMPDNVNDRLEFDLIAKPGHSITEVRISEEGDYDILGNGRVSVSGELFVENLRNNQEEFMPLEVEPVMPVTSGTELWTGSSTITGLNWTYLKIVLCNNLFAFADSDSAAMVYKKSVGAPLTIQIIPEPATICLLAIGSLAFVERKK